MNRYLFMAVSPVVGEDPLAPARFHITTESVLLFGAIGLVVLGLLAWAYLYYTNRREDGHHRHHHGRHHHRHHHHHEHSEQHSDNGPRTADTLAADESGDDENPSGGSSDGERRYRRRRRRRRDHRPRNPTLAETGGLPPVRTDAPPGP